MAIPFSGGTKVNQTFSGASRSTILDGLKTNLPHGGMDVASVRASRRRRRQRRDIHRHDREPGRRHLQQSWMGKQRRRDPANDGRPSDRALCQYPVLRPEQGGEYLRALDHVRRCVDQYDRLSERRAYRKFRVFPLGERVQANVTNPIRIRAKDNRGNCIQFTIENTAGTLAGTSGTGNAQGGCLLPAAAKTFRILASQFHFMVFTPGVSAAREFVHCGMPYVPTDLTGVTDIGFVMSNTVRTTGARQTVPICMRYGPFMQHVGSNTPQSNSGIYGSNLFEQSQSTNHSGAFQVLVSRQFHGRRGLVHRNLGVSMGERREAAL
jgi:hypothetical protein